MQSFTVLQLADSAFPVGGFAHSGGLEAMHQAGLVRDACALERFCLEAVHQTGHAVLPFVGAAHDAPSRLAELDAMARAMLWSHVAARASRAQGRALVDGALRAFGIDALRDTRASIVHGDLDGHFAPVLGFVTRTVGVARDDALLLAAHGALRATLSAAVRLGIVGPFEAQSIQHRLVGAQEKALSEGRTRPVEDVAQIAPLVEIFQGTQDRLYSRLFQS